MALTNKQTAFGIVITCLAVFIAFKFIDPTTLMTLGGVFITALGLLMLVISVLMKRGNLKPSAFWARCPAEAFWQGIGGLALGLGNLSHLVVENNLALKLRIASSLVFLVAILVARKMAKVAEAGSPSAAA